MFCKQCGMQIEDNWIVCPNCGAKLSSDNITEELAQGENNTEKLNLGNNEMRVKNAGFPKAIIPKEKKYIGRLSVINS